MCLVTPYPHMGQRAIEGGVPVQVPSQVRACRRLDWCGSCVKLVLSSACWMASPCGHHQHKTRSLPHLNCTLQFAWAHPGQALRVSGPLLSHAYWVFEAPCTPCLCHTNTNAILIGSYRLTDGP